MDIQGYVVTSGSKWIKPESDLELVPAPPQQDSRPTVQVHWQIQHEEGSPARWMGIYGYITFVWLRRFPPRWGHGRHGSTENCWPCSARAWTAGPVQCGPAVNISMKRQSWQRYQLCCHNQSRQATEDNPVSRLSSGAKLILPKESSCNSFDEAGLVGCKKMQRQ